MVVWETTFHSSHHPNIIISLVSYPSAPALHISCSLPPFRLAPCHYCVLMQKYVLKICYLNTVPFLSKSPPLFCPYHSLLELQKHQLYQLLSCLLSICLELPICVTPLLLNWYLLSFFHVNPRVSYSTNALIFVLSTMTSFTNIWTSLSLQLNTPLIPDIPLLFLKGWLFNLRSHVR